MNALGRIHRSLVPGGTLVDIHPVAPEVRAESGGRPLGSFEGSQFLADVAAAEGKLESTGLWRLEDEERFDVITRCDGPKEALEHVRNYTGYTIPKLLAERVRAAEPPVDIREYAVVRRFRAR